MEEQSVFAKILFNLLNNLPQTILAIAGAVAAVFAYRQSKLNARVAAATAEFAIKKADAVEIKTDELIKEAKHNTLITNDTNQKAESIKEQTTVIHDQTNSNLQDVKQQLALAIKEQETSNKQQEISNQHIMVLTQQLADLQGVLKLLVENRPTITNPENK